MAYIADSFFGVTQKARTILSVLTSAEPTFAVFIEEAQMYDVCIKTTPYYLGSQGSVALTLYPKLTPDGPAQVIVFGEGSKDHNQYQVEVWAVGEIPLEGPTPEVKQHFEVQQFASVEGAVAYIKECLASGYQTLRGVTVAELLAKYPPSD